LKKEYQLELTILNGQVLWRMRWATPEQQRSSEQSSQFGKFKTIVTEISK